LLLARCEGLAGIDAMLSIAAPALSPCTKALHDLAPATPNRGESRSILLRIQFKQNKKGAAFAAPFPHSLC
jgi:hypothetical protein